MVSRVLKGDVPDFCRRLNTQVLLHCCFAAVCQSSLRTLPPMRLENPSIPSPDRIVVAGGGAAGFFAAVTAARLRRESEVVLLEKGPQFLSKVRISGGGRCNVTHACFDPREFSRRYPRGGRALIGAFHRFQAEDTVEWFRERGVMLKTEADGRMFPVTDSSTTIIDCLVEEAKRCGVQLRTRCGIESVSIRSEGGFDLADGNGESICADRLLLATGGCRSAKAGSLAESLGHRIEPPVPSLFTFHIATPWLRKLPGLSLPDVEVSVPGTKLKERGPLLVTHWGVSGPSILRLSAWGARELHDRGYAFPLRIRWLPDLRAEVIRSELQRRRETEPARLVANSQFPPLPARLWEQLVSAAGIAPDTRWAKLPGSGRDVLARLLDGTELPVSGKSTNKDEFVTCGGVRLREVDFRTMESRVTPGLFFAGEILDIDGITGGFNFQAAWTTGWIAGYAMAGLP
jgi:predicted Rossmann fold flavoprotein